MKRVTFKLFMWILIFTSVGIWVSSCKRSIKLEQNCTGHIGLACHSYNINFAKLELGTTIKWLERNNLTNGYTSAYWQTPDEDISFWYKNLKGAYNMLDSTSRCNPTITETNITLLRLRQTLSTSDGTNIICPSGLSTYPDNKLWVWLYWISALCIIGGLFGLFSYYNYKISTF